MTIDKRLLTPLALCVAGAALALGACGDDDEDETTAVNQTEVVVTDAQGNTTATTTTDVRSAESGAPGDAAPTVESCIELWNGANNAQNQTLLAGKTDEGDDAAINVSPNTASDPPTCVVTVVKDDQATEWGQAAGQDFPYATPADRDAAELEPERKEDNADADGVGKLTAAG
jgi:hypothetical protein